MYKKMCSKRVAKSFLTLIILFLSCFVAKAQTLSSGGWRTSTANPFTRITASNNLGTKLYRIDCTNMVDNSILQFRITVDGAAIQATFQEGSYIVVEGNDVTIQQLGSGTMVKGTWTILQQPDILATTIPWNYFPTLTNDLLVASLKVEQEFLLSINYTSINCANTSFTVFIDGQPVRDASNNVLKFLEGSTIYGKGKYITIRASGTCATNSAIYGDLKLRK